MSIESRLMEIARDEAAHALESYEFINIAETYGDELTDDELKRVHDIVTGELVAST